MPKKIIEGSEDFFDLAIWLRAAGAEDKKLAGLIRRSLRDVARPLAIDARDALADAMPKRGGLSGVVRAARPGVSTSVGGSRVARIEATVRAPGIALAAMDAGNLRHPVFGRKAWVSQRVPAGHAQRAFEDGMPEVRKKLQREVERLLHDIASKVGR